MTGSEQMSRKELGKGSRAGKIVARCQSVKAYLRYACPTARIVHMLQRCRGQKKESRDGGLK
jgi:hypothetical protein